MPKNSLTTIYNLLNQSFWTQRKCFHCQNFFTLSDYQTQNYQLFFLKVLKTQNNHLEVIVQLSHYQCPLSCGFNYQKEIVCV